MDTSSNTVSDLYVLGAVGQAARDSAATQCMDTTAILQGQAGKFWSRMQKAEAALVFYHIVLMNFAPDCGPAFFEKAEVYVERVKAECDGVVSYLMKQNVF